MHVIAVANQKGGVAKTTTALSLAGELARGGQRVLALDLDPQGNLGSGVGIELGLERPATFELLTTKTTVEQAALPLGLPGLPGLSLVAAGPRLAQAEGQLLGQVGFDEVLKHKLRAAEKRWDSVVIDCPPSLGALTVNALGAADLIVVPVQCELFSARGVVKLLEVVELVRERRNPGLALLVVPTLFDQRNNVCRGILAELQKELGQDVSQVVVGIDTRVRESQARKLPLCLYAPESRAGQAYRALAREAQARLAARPRTSEVNHGVQAA